METEIDLCLRCTAETFLACAKMHAVSLVEIAAAFEAFMDEHWEQFDDEEHFYLGLRLYEIEKVIADSSLEIREQADCCGRREVPLEGGSCPMEGTPGPCCRGAYRGPEATSIFPDNLAGY